MKLFRDGRVSFRIRSEAGAVDELGRGTRCKTVLELPGEVLGKEIRGDPLRRDRARKEAEEYGQRNLRSEWDDHREP